MIAQFLIGGTSSGGGKTTLTTGLLRLLRNRGYRVQPFKCGPDYIDPQYHKMASGRVSINLDNWLASGEHLHNLYARHSQEADISVTEGVMGLYDGYKGMEGSSARIAELLDLPILLVVNAQSTAYSVAATLFGFSQFYPKIRLIGVIFNKVASPRHYAFLQEAASAAKVPCLGYIPRMEELSVPSRHLGLTLDAQLDFDAYADRIAETLEKYVEVDHLLELCATNAPAPALPPNTPKGTLRISVAKDEAFNFTYQANLDQLQQLGSVSYFSPLTDSSLPPSDLIYIPGGYPEFFLPQLAQNRQLQEEIRDYVAQGGKLLAECGGMMYLCRSITNEKGKSYPMVGVLPQEATMQNMRLHLGYRTLTIQGQEPWQGHEFHYSSVVTPHEPIFNYASSVKDARGNDVETPLYRIKNCIAGYTHLYWGERNILDLWKA